MANYTSKQIIGKAQNCKTNVEKNYKLGITSKWSYYFAKQTLKTGKDIKKITFQEAPSPKGTSISRQIDKEAYIGLAKNLTSYVEKNKRLPNYLTYAGYQLRPKLYTYIFARILVFYNNNKRLPSQVNANSKAFTKPVETKNTAYNYFCKVFGKKVQSIDEALSLVENKGYAYYYDDIYSCRESIDRMKKGLGINCTDSCHVFYNVVLGLIELGKYKKVECLHVNCSSGGHVKLRITLKDGSKIIRDPACVLSNNRKGIKCVWCTNTPKAVNPAWFMENLYR